MKNNDKVNILVGVISIYPQAIKKLLKSMENINSKNIQINFLIFANHPTYSQPICNLPKSNIEYISLEGESSLDIPQARNYLHLHILEYCLNQTSKPIVWLLDEDITIDDRANEYLLLLPHLRKSRNIDILIGSLEGDSPNATFSGMQGELHDLIENLQWLDTLNEKSILPNRKKRNQGLREKYSDYYYDLSSLGDKHLSETFWIERENDKETVENAKSRIYKNIKYIESGKNIFRYLKAKQTMTRKPEELIESLSRGANAFVFNLDVLKIKNPTIKVNNINIRRSDMLWALINKVCHRNILSGNFPVLHNRAELKDKELGIDKTLKEIYGSIIFNAIKKYENNKYIPFRDILELLVNKKVRAVENSFKKTLSYIDTLSKYNIPEISSFCKQIKIFYNLKNLELIVSKLQKLQQYEDDIYTQFDSYAPLVKYKCLLKHSHYGDFNQYDIGNDDVKIFSKVDILTMNKNITPHIRIQSSCANSEIFKANDCDCASQLDKAMKTINKENNGIIFYINQEGRGHGYSKKIAIVHKMQKDNKNTYEACESLNLKNDIRDYKIVADILKKIGISEVVLLSNNTKKIKNLEKYDIKVDRKPLKGITNKDNMEYLQSKQKSGNHKDLVIDEDMLNSKYKPSNDFIKFYEKEDKYGEFSNFSEHPFLLDGFEWKTSEHYYQAQKFIHYPDIMSEIMDSKNPTIAKEISRVNNDKVDESWNDKKITVMCIALRQKLKTHKKISKILLETNKVYIIENALDDSFWGYGKNGNGKNMLGKLLMFIRDELRNASCAE